MKHLLFFGLFLSMICFSCTDKEEQSRSLTNEGTDLLYSSRFDEAIAKFDEAITLNPQNAEAYYFRGCAKSNNFLREEAKADWEKAIELRPDYIEPHFNLGLYYKSIDDMGMACHYFKIAEKLGRPNMEDYTKFCGYY